MWVRDGKFSPHFRRDFLSFLTNFFGSNRKLLLLKETHIQTSSLSCWDWGPLSVYKEIFFVFRTLLNSVFMAIFRPILVIFYPFLTAESLKVSHRKSLLLKETHIQTSSGGDFNGRNKSCGTEESKATRFPLGLLVNNNFDKCLNARRKCNQGFSKVPHFSRPTANHGSRLFHASTMSRVSPNYP